MSLLAAEALLGIALLEGRLGAIAEIDPLAFADRGHRAIFVALRDELDAAQDHGMAAEDVVVRVYRLLERRGELRLLARPKDGVSPLQAFALLMLGVDVAEVRARQIHTNVLLARLR